MFGEVLTWVVKPVLISLTELKKKKKNCDELYILFSVTRKDNIQILVIGYIFPQLFIYFVCENGMYPYPQS